MEKKAKTHNLGERIKQLRLANRMTQSSLAEMLFMSDKVISKWEKGKSIPDVDILLDISEIFHVSIEYLLTGKTSKAKVKGGQVIYNDDGTISHYIGEDGDRLFTRDEVTVILRRRLDRYQNSIFEKYGVKDSSELDRVVATFYYLKNAFLGQKSESLSNGGKYHYPFGTLIEELKNKNVSNESIDKIIDEMRNNSGISEQDYEFAKSYIKLN